MRPIVILIFIILAGGTGFLWLREGPGSVRHAPPGNGPIVALGDSLTFGFGAPSGGGYVDQLSELIGRPIVNRGVNGDDIAGAHARLQRDVLALRPGVVIVLIGGNDYLRRHDMERAFAELDQMLGEISRSGAMIVLVGLEGFIPFSGYGKRFKQLAAKHKALHVPDVMDGLLSNPKLMADQIHPNAAGYAIMAQRIATQLKPVLH